MNNVIAFGDVHGKAHLLAKFLKKVRKEYGYDIELWSCGDLVDRGGTEKEVISICSKEGIKAVVGNHDLWMLELIVHQRLHPNMIQALSAYSTLESYGVDWNKLVTDLGWTEGWATVAVEFLNALPEDHISYILNMYDVGMIDWLDDKVYWFLHAGLRNVVAKKYGKGDGDLAMMQRITTKAHDSILWPRPDFRGKKDNLYHFDNGVQVFGHSYTKHPIVKDHFVALDTIGWGKEDKWTLSGIVLPEMKVIQVTED